MQEASRRKRPLLVEMLIKAGAPAPEEEKKEKLVPKAKPKPV